MTSNDYTVSDLTVVYGNFVPTIPLGVTAGSVRRPRMRDVGECVR